jgi:hypothetical protein
VSSLGSVHADRDADASWPLPAKHRLLDTRAETDAGLADRGSAVSPIAICTHLAIAPRPFEARRKRSSATSPSRTGPSDRAVPVAIAPEVMERTAAFVA